MAVFRRLGVGDMGSGSSVIEREIGRWVAHVRWFEAPDGGKGAYARIEYKASGRTLEKWLKGQPEVRSLYPRAAFFLLHGSGYQPQALLEEWYSLPQWKQMRGEFSKQRRKAFETAMSALTAKRLGQLYTPKRAAVSRPTALSFPLLPSEFSVFVAHEFAHMHGGHRGTVPPGIYACEVVEWSEENSYADSIRLTSPSGDTYHVDQTGLLDALRGHLAAVESVSFLGLPIYMYTDTQRKLPNLRSEQRVAGRLTIRKGSERDYAQLDKALIKVFGGANPINVLRLSLFYHPHFGVNPDEAKYQRLLQRANKMGG